MVIPKPGTPGFEQFVRKAMRDPQSLEASVIKQMNDSAASETQDYVRKMLYSMIELVPGQLFRDIGRFHAKFGLDPTAHPNHELPYEILAFRIKFMLEELIEYCKSVGVLLKVDHDGSVQVLQEAEGKFVAKDALDGLIDLVYVALGTAFLHRFPFNEGWARVQAANMAKERATGDDDPRSTRKHKIDIVKPAGWTPPVLEDLLGRGGTPCKCPIPRGGGGQASVLAVVASKKEYCEICGGEVIQDGSSISPEVEGARQELD